jgi:hypothetical protein
VELETEFSLILRSDGSLNVSVNSVMNQQVHAITKESERRRLISCSLTGRVTNPTGEISITKLVLNRTSFKYTRQQASVTFQLVSIGNAVIEYVPLMPHQSIEVHYGLTNFDFMGCEYSREENRTARDKFRANLENVEFTFKQAKNHRNIITGLSNDHDVAVTAEAIVSNEFSILGKLEEILDSVATLLSFATGNYISWVYRDVYSSGALVGSVLYSHNTGPFVHREWVIDASSLRDCDLRTFLETTLPAYNNLKTDLGLNVVLEFVVVANQGRYPEVEFLLNSVAAECLLSHLSVYFKKIGKEGDMRSFKSKMKELLNYFGVVYTESELDFIRTRDEIVHTGRFPTGMDRHEATMKFRNLLHRTMLTILGYRGKYYLNQASHYEREVLR